MRAAPAWALALLVPAGAEAAAQGVSEQEYRTLRPEPAAISARFERGATLLEWGAPEPRPGEVVRGYRVERFAGPGAPGMTVEVAANAFVDPAPPKGRLTYVVTALSADGRALRRWTAAIDAP